jgi:hypothetical protein
MPAGRPLRLPDLEATGLSCASQLGGHRPVRPVKFGKDCARGLGSGDQHVFFRQVGLWHLGIRLLLACRRLRLIVCLGSFGRLGRLRLFGLRGQVHAQAQPDRCGQMVCFHIRFMFKHSKNAGDADEIKSPTDRAAGQRHADGGGGLAHLVGDGNRTHGRSTLAC